MLAWSLRGTLRGGMMGWWAGRMGLRGGQRGEGGGEALGCLPAFLTAYPFGVLSKPPVTHRRRPGVKAACRTITTISMHVCPCRRATAVLRRELRLPSYTYAVS